MARVWNGIAAGVTGAAALEIACKIEDRYWGKAVFEPAAMLTRLARRDFGRKLSSKEAKWAGRAMRWPYGAAWGAVGTLALQRLPFPLAALALGSIVAGFELAILPFIGATPKVDDWGSRQVVEDIANCLLYALATTSVLRLGRTGGAAKPLAHPKSLL